MGNVERSVFVSYSHADIAWVNRLKVHLRPLIRQGTLAVWDDSQITPGQRWEDQIRAALASARIAILLVSADFLASDFIANHELPQLLHRAAEDGLLVVPLILGPCLFSENAELARYQTANDPGRPLALMPTFDAEAALVALARSVDQYFRQLDAAQAVKPAPTAVHAARGSGDPFTGRTGSADPLVVSRPMNLGFDGPAVNSIPVGWFNSFGHVSGVSTDYDIRIVARSAARADGTCAVLEKLHAIPIEFGSMMQRCRGRFLAGQTVRLEGDLRTDDVTGWAGLWLRADSDDHPNLFFDNMSRRPVVGTTAWARYSIDALLPASTVWLNYGVVLSGPGSLYADSLRLLKWTEDSRWEDV